MLKGGNLLVNAGGLSQEYEDAGNRSMDSADEEGQPLIRKNAQNQLLHSIPRSSRFVSQEESTPIEIEKDLEFQPVTSKNIVELRSVNSVLFPMSYHENYYRSILSGEGLARLIYWRGELVATFSCRSQLTEAISGSFGTSMLAGEKFAYIMTFGVLAPYRRLGVGSAILNYIDRLYRRPLTASDVKGLALHVHTANKMAVSFYERHGFSVIANLDGYYARLSPTTAKLLFKCIE